MAKVHILNVTVHNNPAPFFTPFQFEIHFECLEELQDDLEFKIIYVGSAETYEFDQVLDQIVVDAVPQGQFKFMFQADPPDISKIPADDAVGVTVVLITASYREQEFVRVGYYVTNEYEDMEMRENPPAEPQFDKLVRTIAATEPRVTKFKINWDSTAQAAAAAAAAADVAALAATTSSGVDCMTANSASGADSRTGVPTSQDQEAATTKKSEFEYLNNKENIVLQQQQKLSDLSVKDDKMSIINYDQTSQENMMC
jgi:histone chaperone ASF1